MKNDNMEKVKECKLIGYENSFPIYIIDKKEFTSVDDSVLVDICGKAIARGVLQDSEGNLYYAYFNIENEQAEELENACNWDVVDYIELTD